MSVEAICCDDDSKFSWLGGTSEPHSDSGKMTSIGLKMTDQFSTVSWRPRSATAWLKCDIGRGSVESVGKAMTLSLIVKTGRV